MNEKIPDDLLRRYLLGALSEAELEQFEKLLINNPELAEDLALQRAEMAASELLIAADTREWFEEWKQPHQSFFGKGVLWWLLLIAAGIALLLAAIWFFSQPTSPAQPGNNQQAPTIKSPAQNKNTTPVVSPQAKMQTPNNPAAAEPQTTNHLALAKKYTEAPLLSAYRRFPTDTATSLYRQAQSAYAAGAYQQALDLLAQTDSSQLQSATFLSAHALFQLQRFSEAEIRFKHLIDGNSRQYRYASEWGLLMCRLSDFKNRNPDLRRQLQDILANPQHPYFEQAKKLEQALKE